MSEYTGKEVSQAQELPEIVCRTIAKTLKADSVAMVTTGGIIPESITIVAKDEFDKELLISGLLRAIEELQRK